MMIRPMTESDLEAVARILTASVPGAASWTREQLRETLANPALYGALIAEESGWVAGFVCFHVAADEAELDNLAVAPQSRRKGIATRLLHHACQLAAGRGARTMFLEVRRSNAAALHLYRKCGFLPAGIRSQYYANPSEDAIRLERCFGPVNIHA